MCDLLAVDHSLQEAKIIEHEENGDAAPLSCKPRAGALAHPSWMRWPLTFCWPTQLIICARFSGLPFEPQMAMTSEARKAKRRSKTPLAVHQLGRNIWTRWRSSFSTSV